MATQEQLWLIYQIYQVDEESAALERAQAKLDDGSVLAQAVVQQQKAVADRQEALRQAERAVRDAELELAALEEKKQRIQQILYSGRVTNPKELQGYEAEAKSLQRQLEALEDRVLARMEEADAAKERLAEAQQHAARLQRRWQARVAAYQREVADLNERQEQLRRRRQALCAQAEPSLLRRYEQARSQNRRFVGRVEAEVCGACGIRLPGRVVKEYKTHPDAELTCPTCGAELLWRVPAEESD